MNNNKFKSFCLSLYLHIRIIINRRKYVIIPCGTYCLPRCISTFSKLKPRKSLFEKTCPFDLAFFNDLNVVVNLIDSKFENFFDDIKFNPETKFYESKKLNAIFNHDGKLSKEKFVERYKNRISNLYKYIANKRKHKYFLISTFEVVNYEFLSHAVSVLSKFMDKKDFDIILINQSQERNNLVMENVYIINQNENYADFKKMYDKCEWLLHIKKLDTPEAIRIYNSITSEMFRIIGI